MTRQWPPLTAFSLGFSGYFGLALTLLFAGGLLGCKGSGEADSSVLGISPGVVRIATFNSALSRDAQGDLHRAFSTGKDAQAALVAEVLQRTRPDIVLLQEVDYDPTGKAYADFQAHYLSVPQNGAEPIEYPHVYAPPVNTGVLAGVDLNGDGKIARPGDCFGHGLFEGQYGMVVLSRSPIHTARVQTFREVLWRETPRNSLPRGYYNDKAIDIMRLSSKTHARVPVLVGGQPVHLLISHPTPPVFDGPEDRNGRRNYDEIGLWLYLLEPGSVGKAGAFPPIDGKSHSDRLLIGERFVIMGDLNADPNEGDSRPGATNRLLQHPRIQGDIAPASEGGAEAARLQGGENRTHKTDPATDTADWNDDPRKGSGNLRVDYVLPSKNLQILKAGVYWPTRDDPYAYLNKASDHKLVWIDVRVD